jgi:hypothetical protein
VPSLVPLLDTASPAAATTGVTDRWAQSADAVDVPGDGFLERLRSPLVVRPAVDAGLSGGLRAWLEDGVAAGPIGDVTVEAGPNGAPAVSPGQSGRPSDRELRAALLRAVFRMTVTSGPPRAAFEDALAALAVDEEGTAIVDAVQRLTRHRRAQLRELVRRAGRGVVAQWSPPPASWLPRTGERLSVPLAGGRIVLRSGADLIMGPPSTGRASVCAVRSHGGTLSDPGADRRFLALLETLRSGAAPFRVASYDLDRGTLTVDDVGEEHLSAAVQDVLRVVVRHSEGPVRTRGAALHGAVRAGQAVVRPARGTTGRRAHR